MAAPAQAPSLYSQTADVIKQMITGYLGVSDTLTKFTVLDRSHVDLFWAKGFWGIAEASIPGKHLDKLGPREGAIIPRENALFPRLVTLQPTGNADYPPLNPVAFETVSRLIVDESELPNAAVPRLLEAIPRIRDLRLGNRPPYGDQRYFQPHAGECLSAKARSHLCELTHLNLAGSNIDPRGVLAFLKCSDQLQTVNLSEQTLSDAALIELGRSQNLQHLILKWTCGDFNYRLIAHNCHSLVSFAPGKNIGRASERATNDLRDYLRAGAVPDEARANELRAALTAAAETDGETLLAIVAANPQLIDLDLSLCPDTIITDAFLTRLAAPPSNLRNLELPFESRITDEGFRALVEGCPLLEKLHLGSIKYVSLGAIKMLQDHCPNLSDLAIKSHPLDNAFIETLATKQKLTFLSVAECTGFDANLLQTLVHLAELNLDYCRLTDASVNAIIDHCPLLRSLRLNCWGWESRVTPAILTHIGQAINERRTKLNILSYCGNGIDRAAIDEFRANFPQLHVD